MLICIYIVITGNVSCNRHIKLDNIYEAKNRESLNYNNLNNWAAHPMKSDMSDSISNEYLNEINEDLVDVFFLHPTTFTDKKRKYESNANEKDSVINDKTDKSSILYQASVFNQIGRIYAPRYRQAHINRYYMYGDDQKNAFNFAYLDIVDAFDHYLKNYNQGRPIIIAGHSQGTTHAIRLIKEYVDNHTIQNKIILYYLIGMPVKKNEFSNVCPCTKKNELGCFYSWRTYRKGYSGKYVDKDDRIIHVNNPVDIENFSEWSQKKSKDKSILWNYNEGYDAILRSKVKGNMLWITRPKFPGGLLGIFMKNYHAGDINLFYGDIRKLVHENVSLYHTLNEID